jgi:hypothetical protein
LKILKPVIFDKIPYEMTGRVLITILVACCASSAFAQNYFQNNRKAFQKARYGQTTKKYGQACEIFEKKRVKGEKKPLLSLGLGRSKRKPKMAEQN